MGKSAKRRTHAATARNPAHARLQDGEGRIDPVALLGRFGEGVVTEAEIIEWLKELPPLQVAIEIAKRK